MSDKWSTQRALRVRVCAVLAMHVPSLGIHTLWQISLRIQHFLLFSTGQKESACPCL